MALYLVGSIVVNLIVTIFRGGVGGAENALNIESYIGNSLVANLIISLILVFVAFVLFKDSRKDIFFERAAFHLSRLYWAIPLVEVGIRGPNAAHRARRPSRQYGYAQSGRDQYGEGDSGLDGQKL